MKKLKILVMSTVIASMVLTGCSSTGKNTSAGDGQESIKKLENLKPISEVSQSAYSDLQEAKSKTEKLIFEDIKPYCPDVDTVYDINIDRTGIYKNIDNEKDMLTEQFAITEVLLDKSLEELDMECFETGYYWLGDRGGYNSFEEFKNDSQENEKREPSTFGYVKQDEMNLLTSFIQRSIDTVSFYRGKCYEAMYDYRMADESGITTTITPYMVCDTVKTYNVYSESDNFEDKWKLADCEISVREGIEFVENYVNNELHDKMQLEGCSDEVKLSVESVQVIKINENYYCFKYSIRAEIGGVAFPSIDSISYSVGSIDIWYDQSVGYQIERNSLDIYDGHTKRIIYDKLNETNEILPLSEAIKIVEDNIGLNSKYTVKGVELGYMAMLNKDQTEGTGTVCWVFNCVNELDGWITEFYVNAQTGEIKTNSRHP